MSDEEMAAYLTLAENFGNSARWLSAQRGAPESSFRTTLAWIVATSAIVGFLAAMLIAGIAITV